MKSHYLPFCSALGLLALAGAFGPSTGASAGTFIQFDLPGHKAPMYYGTEALSINSSGVVVGTFVGLRKKGYNKAYGFIRTPDGVLTEFNAPRQKGTTGLFQIRDDMTILGNGFLRSPDGKVKWIKSQFAEALFYSLNDKDQMAGTWLDESGLHGLARVRKKEDVPFDPPGAKSETPALSINRNGQIAGNFYDANLVRHGFVRDSAGNITTFDTPDAGTQNNQGTIALGINDGGVIAGMYIDAAGGEHGFVRQTDGSITEFDVPGATYTYLSTQNGSVINSAGAIVGGYTGSDGHHNYGFVRNPDGSFVTITAPVKAFAFGVESINDNGVVTGSFYDGTHLHLQHGFVWTP